MSSSTGAMDSAVIPFAGSDSSDDDVEVQQSMNVEIPEWEGIPRRLWNTKCVTLYNEDGLHVGDGTCHSVSSDLVLDANSPLGDSHVVVHIVRSHSEADIPRDWTYSLRAWPIRLVHINGASLHDHEVRDNYNRRQASLSQPSSSRSARPYTSTVRNPPRESSVKSLDLLT